jgi:hypothetical protein
VVPQLKISPIELDLEAKKLPPGSFVLECDVKDDTLCVTFTLNPFLDLSLETPCTFVLTMTAEFPDVQPTVMCTNPDIFPGGEYVNSYGVLRIHEDGVVELPILNEGLYGWRPHYPMAAVFFSLRELFKLKEWEPLGSLDLTQASVAAEVVDTDTLYPPVSVCQEGTGSIRSVLIDELYLGHELTPDIGSSVSLYALLDGHGDPRVPAFVQRELEEEFTHHVAPSIRYAPRR